MKTSDLLTMKMGGFSEKKGCFFQREEGEFSVLREIY